MAKKRKASSTQQPPAKLQERASKALKSGKFREAIELHKQLLKQESQPNLLQGLASAYLGRAKELAGKGMYKEAAALWENMATSCGERDYGHYLEWLLIGGRLERGARLLLASDDAFRASAEGNRLTTLLALQLLGQPEGVGDVLPADSPWWSQREAMLRALQGYCTGDDATLRSALKTIPFRSPYRDLRTLLQALVQRETDAIAASQQLSRIPSHSPLAPLTQQLEDKSPGDIATVLALPVPLRELQMSLQNWPPAQRQSLAQFPAQDADDPKAVLRFALALKEVDEGLLRRFCLAWLPLYPKGKESVERRLGSLSQAEYACMQAQLAEQRQDLDGIEQHWPRCARALVAEEQPLAAALVYRHMAMLHERSHGSNPWDDTVERYLNRSLELDPVDLDSYLKMAALALERSDIKLSYEVAKRAVVHYPDDVKVRVLAASSAYRCKAFKQAADHAAVAMARDPLHSHARSLLLLGQVAQARQHVKKGRHDLAQDDLDAAAKVLGDSEYQAILHLVRGLIHLSDKQRDVAHEQLTAALAVFGEGLPTRFRFLVHGKRMHLNQRTLTRTYNQLSPPDREPPPTPTTLMSLADLVKRFLIDGDAEVLDTLDQLQKPLKAATHLNLDEQQYRTWLDVLFEVKHYRLLEQFADVACRRFRDNLWFPFYLIYARSRGNESRMKHLDRHRLYSVEERAIELEDHRLAQLIDDYLDEEPMPPFLGTESMDLPPMPPEIRQALQAAMDEMGTDDPREILKIIAQMEAGMDFPMDFPFLPPSPQGRRR